MASFFSTKVEKQVQYIYAATQGMRAVYLYAAVRQGISMQQDRGRGLTIITCVTPPFIMGLHMLLLLHALVPCLAAYILPL